MKILIDIGHPAHVHQYRNAIKILKADGHEIFVTARNKEVTLDLLNKFGMNYEEVGQYKKNNTSKAVEMFRIDYKLYKLAKRFNPDVLIGGVGNVYVAHVSALINKPSILFNDTEHGTLQNVLSYPFASAICTPSCFNKDLGKKQIRYNGYHELAYLHPNYFKPSPAVLDELGLSKDDTFIILRFVSWDASHDVGQHGIQDKTALVRELEKYGRVLITSEGLLPKELEKYKIKVSPEEMHDLLYYASLYVGEGGTMATESAILGTPSIYISSLVGTMGNFIELKQKYGLTFNYNDSDNAMNKAVNLIQKPGLKKEWQRKREQLLEDKIDVTTFMVWFVENYPESFKEMKENPEMQERFR